MGLSSLRRHRGNYAYAEPSAVVREPTIEELRAQLAQERTARAAAEAELAALQAPGPSDAVVDASAEASPSELAPAEPNTELETAPSEPSAEPETAAPSRKRR